MGDMDLIHLSQDRDQWRALANTVMKIIISQKMIIIIVTAVETSNLTQL
jgi:hypothetical protein